MNRNYRWMALIGMTALLLSQFNNCSSYNDSSTLASALSLNCLNSSCITPDPTLVSIQANLDNGEYDVKSGITEFNIGGDCNEGGYPVNVITWTLNNGNNTVQRSSTQPIVVSGSQQGANSLCLNGRFLIYVNLAAINGLPAVNLATGGYNLKISIQGSGSTTVSVSAPVTANVPLGFID